MNIRTLVVIFVMLNAMIGKVSAYYDDYFLPEDDVKDKGAISENKLRPTDYDDVQEVEKYDKYKPTGFTCGLCIVVDEQFSLAYNIKDETALKNSMYRLVDHASWIFRSSDWDNDGTPDNVGLKIIKISFGWKPFKKETQKHYETPKKALDLLKIFSRLDFNKCCLGVGFTNRPFFNGLDGIAFGASDRLLGGICDHRNPREDFMTNMNTVLISGRGWNKTQLSSYQIAKALVHELGHAFGVHAHDNDFKDAECWGFKPEEDTNKGRAKPADGRFIMWSRSPKRLVSTLSKNTLRFSRCSDYAISGIVAKRKSRQKCFDLEYNPYCGNGIIEGVELCDCGNEYDCSQQKCCSSRKTKKPCMINDLSSCPSSIVSKVGGRKNETNASYQPRTRFSHIIFNLFLVFRFTFE